MCGIVGLYLKDPGLRERLGALFAPMLVELTDRGPDSAGLAVYHDPAPPDHLKLVLFHPDPDFAWDRVHDALGPGARLTPRASHAVVVTEGEPRAIEAALAGIDRDLQIMSEGRVIEIYKETGLPDAVTRRFAVPSMAGSHAIGHTRMATESAVTTAGSHPFSTGLDLCLVHNGSLSNHNWLRAGLARRYGMAFKTENDTEVAAAYVTSRLLEGRTLHQALEDGLADLDGFYTFCVGTADGFAVLRDPIACKPAVLAETEGWVAMASEYRALVGLPGIEDAKVWEPEPATVYSWGGQA
jgi:methylamine---glutamate N-methyltransferase subunit A